MVRQAKASANFGDFFMLPTLALKTATVLGN